MTAFGKLIRTTAFRLTLVYLFLFALFAASLLGYFAWNTRRLITEQITATVNAEIAEITDIYTRRRPARPGSHASSNRALRPGANLYLVTTPTGRALAGNVESLSPGVMASTGWTETAYRRLDEQDTARSPRAGARHPTRPTVSACWSAAISRSAGGCSASSPSRAMVAAGRHRARPRRRHLRGAAGAAADRRHDRHHPAHHGRRSFRPAAGRAHGDELDRLAENLNAMLERIEALMTGLKEVSDNIAHDLKTPLTRCATAPRRRWRVPAARPNTARRWNGPSRNPTA